MRALVYDRTCVGRVGGMSTFWSAGSALYRRLGRIDAALGVASWDEALGWLAALPEPIHELQYWGHGKWGCAFVDDDVLDAGALAAASPRRAAMEALRAQLAPDALVWFRTCETFGARAGQGFAERLADFLGARVAGHTYVIGFHQSGLHAVDPGCRATWAATEGLAEGDADAPRRARRSHPWAPNTITCLRGEVPAAFVG
jgi:Domain of unknown function (DUF4347)